MKKIILLMLGLLVAGLGSASAPVIAVNGHALSLNGHFVNAVPISVTPDQDFANRCAATGVTLCAGLNNSTDLAAGIQTAGDGTIQGSIDPVIKVSGAGSIVFLLRAGVSYSNIGGAWSVPLGRQYGVGDVINVQFRYRVDAAYNSNNLGSGGWGGTSIKLTNIHGDSSTCQATEFTTIVSPGGSGGGAFNYPSLYTHCGNGWFINPTTGLIQPSCPGSCLLEQGANLTPSPSGSGYNGNYQNQVAGDGKGTGFMVFAPNTWYTVMEQITLGARGSATTNVYAWTKLPSAVRLQFQNVPGATWDTGGDSTFGHIRLETYMTEIAGAASVDAHVWYDELIVSTQPIADPVP